MFIYGRLKGTKRLICPFIFMLVISVISSACTSRSVPVLHENKPGNQACLKEYTALKSLDRASYEMYAGQFAGINKEYATFKNQGNDLNKDAKEILGLELDSKLQLVCARVKNSAFHSMQSRSLELNKI